MAIVEHFGLGRDPFAPTVDPADAFESQAFTAARDTVLRELASGARLVAVVGAAGTGKTLLLQAVEKALARAGRQVRRLDRGDLLSDATATGDVLLIDEADRIDDAGIAALARAAARPSHPAVVLARTRRLDHIDSPAAVRTVALDELGSSDARDFVIDRVRRAGGDAAMFTPGALGAITYAAAGSPRLLRLLASGAMFQAAQEGARRIEMGHARRAIAMQRGGAAAVPEPALAEIAPAAAVAEPAAAAVPLMVSPRAERAPAAAEPPEPVASTAAMPTAEPISPPPAPPPPPISVPPAEASAIEEVEAGYTASRRRPLAAATAVAVIAAAAGLLFWQRSASEAPPPSAAIIEPAPATAIAKAPEPEPEPKLTPTPTPTMVETPAPTPPPPKVEPQPAPVAAAVGQAPVPATEVAAAPAAEPVPETPPRIVVRYAGGQPGAADAAGRIADLLRARGHDVADVRAAPGRIRQATTRYAAGDRKAGEAVNGAFETVLRAYQPGAISRAAPSADGDDARGTIEVWVPDSAAGASRPLRTDLPPG